MTIRILIADDHAVFREGLRSLLQKEDDFEIVGEAENGPDAVEAVMRHEADALVLDLSMPGLPGSKVAAAALEARPQLAIVVLTMHADEYYLQELFKAGARAFVLKKSTSTDLIRAIRAAHRGEQYVDTALAGHVISSYVGRRRAPPAGDRLSVLTRREQEVCRLLAHGHTNAEIAQELGISPRTVETHRMHLMAKLDLKGRAGLVRVALDHGLLRVE